MVIMVKKMAIMALMASPATSSCAYGTWLQPRAEDGTVEVNTFGYIGSTGPANWVALDPDANALCATGTNQSPIDMLPDALSVVPAAELSLSLADMPDGAEFENLGTTVEVIALGEDGAASSTMSFGGVNYGLQQFHFHLPSEHLDNSQSMAMEMHMVWEGESGELAVIGMFIDVDDATSSPPGAAPNATSQRASFRRSLLEKQQRRHAVQQDNKGRRQLPSMDDGFFHITAPTTAATTASRLLETVLGSAEDISEPGTVTKTASLDMVELSTILNSGTFQTYEGSLTTPPCSEGVRWLVSNQKLSIQTGTYLKARSVIGYNARFPQNAPGGENVLSLATKASV